MRIASHRTKLLIMITVAFAIQGLSAQSTFIDYPITENDTLHYNLQLHLDSAGHPTHFYREIFTPVCFTGECKPVYINFYWDLLGNYQKYDLPPREVLTKMDHDEFTEEDYQKLQEILANPSSLLGEVSIEDLVSSGTDQLADSVDAKTGATLKTIKREVIEGAVYTCYTLWHIAYGKVGVNKMREIAETLITPELLHRFLRSDHHHYQYWAVDRVLDDGGNAEATFEEDLMKLIESENIFLARNTLQRLNPDFFKEEPLQRRLMKLYGSKSYAMQLAILKRMQSLALQPSTLTGVIQLIPRTNPEQFDLTLALLAKQNKLPVSCQREIAELLSTLPESKSEKIYGLVQKKITDQQARKKVNAYAVSVPSQKQNSHQK